MVWLAASAALANPMQKIPRRVGAQPRYCSCPSFSDVHNRGRNRSKNRFGHVVGGIIGSGCRYRDGTTSRGGHGGPSASPPKPGNSAWPGPAQAPQKTTWPTLEYGKTPLSGARPYSASTYVGTHSGYTLRCGWRLCLYWGSNEGGAAAGFSYGVPDLAPLVVIAAVLVAMVATAVACSAPSSQPASRASSTPSPTRAPSYPPAPSPPATTPSATMLASGVLIAGQRRISGPARR